VYGLIPSELSTALGAFIAITESTFETFCQNILLLPLKLPSTTDMAPSRKSVKQTIVDPVIQKRKGEMIEAAEPMDRQPTLSDIQISNTEDSYPNITSPLKM